MTTAQRPLRRATRPHTGRKRAIPTIDTPAPAERRLRVLWCSDHPAATSGYSVETALAARYLKDYCDLALLATFGQQGFVREWEGVPVFPGGSDPFANDVIGKAARQWQADVVITLKD